ncbi:hypothetical protein E4G67_05440 [Candidatus Bathyarchaeota archaeon]|nr:MAG: hypothetical protein E4G67_05440 [Candidatus Bathyarchaeota archaeon]
MKKIIFNQSPPDTINASQIKEPARAIIGFEDSTGRRGFATQHGYLSRKFCLAAVTDVQMGNTYGTFDSFEDMMTNLENRGSFKSFLFDNPNELFAWVSQGKLG